MIITENPILFSAPMILKTLAGEKDLTRRIVKPQPPYYIDYFEYMEAGFEGYYIKHPDIFRPFVIPRGRVTYTDIKAKYAPSYRLWARETWGITAYSNEESYEICVKYRADNTESGWIDLDNEELWEKYATQEDKWSRKNFTYCKLRKPEDCPHIVCIGCENQKFEKPVLWRPSIYIPRTISRLSLDILSARIERLHELDDTEARREGFKNRDDFIPYWNGLNEKHGFPWASNPWVYRVEYKVVK
jgi:hypothetical protein